jgi:hypothetical protein
MLRAHAAAVSTLFGPMKESGKNDDFEVASIVARVQTYRGE